MLRLKLLLGGYLRWFDQLLAATFGTRLRSVITVSVIFAVIFLLNNRPAPDAAQQEIDAQELKRAINLAHYFEQENRRLLREVEDERRLRRISDQTTAALSEQLRQQDEDILGYEQRLAFLRQLLEERDSSQDQIDIRSFEIVPDYRENSYQLLAVLNRSGSDSAEFAGSLDLALSLRRANGEEIELKPVFELGALEVKMRYYVEVRSVFNIPPGTEILNGQLALFDAEGNLEASRLLYDQTL